VVFKDMFKIWPVPNDRTLALSTPWSSKIMTFRTFLALLMLIYKFFPGIITILLADAILSKAANVPFVARSTPECRVLNMV
jgi:hypothetical protein